jgi:O-antigen biosynthesis protein
MIVFVLPGPHALPVRKTMQWIHTFVPDWKIVLLQNDVTAALTEELASYAEPYFITIHPGYTFPPNFFLELPQWLNQLPPNRAGLILLPTEKVLSEQALTENPIVWKTNIVKDHGLLEKNQLPFDHYVLEELANRLAVTKGWEYRVQPSFQSNQVNNYPFWMNRSIEWKLISPLLRSPSHPPSNVKPIVSIVLCTYNSAPYLPWAIRSVLHQSIAEWELIIMDDASTDETPQILKETPKEPRIMVNRLQVNRGKSFCLNEALHFANGQWLLELDADDWLTPFAVEQFLLHLPKVNQTDIAAIYGDHYEWLERSNKQLLYKGLRKGMASFDRQNLISLGYPLAPRFYRIESLRRLGGWNLNTPFEGRLYEDIHCLCRLSQKFKVDHIPYALYHQRIRTTSITHQFSNKYRLWREWLENQ